MDQSLDQNKEISALHKINEFLGCIEDLDELLQLIMQEASRTVEAEASSIALYDSQQKDLRFTVSTGEKGKEVKEIRLKMGQGIIGYAAETRKPLNIVDVSKDERFHSDVDKKTQFKSKSILAVPILFKQRLIGALEVINKIGAPQFSDADVRLLEIVAGQAAIAIENAKLYQRLFQKHEALKTKHDRLVEMQKKMLRMERMSAIGDTTSRMVHDLRNPLCAISGCADLLKMPALSQEDRETYARIIGDEVTRLTGMTTEVMDFVKGKTTFLLRDYPIDDLMKEIGTYLERDFQPHNIKLQVESNFKGKACIDKAKIQRAIFNICFNARDAMTAGGSFKIVTNQVDSMLEIRLMDTGPGMPPEVAAKIGEPFNTSGKAHGTGLGLAIVKNIIAEIHKGTFTVESQPPREGEFSTTFIFKIPIAKPAQETSTPT
ncbi:MAG: GAF domain-containing sensor histidine kinase [Candidatus Omnitrophica bacterium]|nr:GAF domain-containing sensor histidine kinase [Candidatus Omnitrophota bacterium]